MGTEELIVVKVASDAVKMVDGGDVGGRHVGHGLSRLLGVEDAALPAHPANAFHPGLAEERRGDSIGYMLQEGEGSSGLAGVDVDESIPGLKKELQIT